MDPISENSTYQKQELLIRMERNHEVIQRLSKKLCSYTCEPKCPSSFEKYNDLKRNFKLFEKYQKNIMDLIHRKKAGAVQGLEREVQLHLKRFRELEADIASYLLDTLEHS
ncbi:hypothetical protein D2V93_17805 [Flagellimonas taeanensis]|uniref:Uncharacterized protein n=1 Tax=Flagellimonas taeanensis TaxID=1005926 RepID=A0A1M6ZST9_9FLAO|nr:MULTISPECIES: hypothetical protein [Allomuricauda]MDC6386304.1 hypothetical protein [Muricauda sp. SK9]RIV48020.1 hypothetical protein D2V93_17805 [Allomuricauda taeanensis]SFC29004.1 hypothetical protein SAMN04487891_108142 [Allomuricauda taeanensis]SHL33415.1 hypothetical protein SAMN05216293_3226 [Allomuricauda taeanensis]